MAAISFEDYYVDEITYKKNKDFQGNGAIELSTEFECTIDIKSVDEAEVLLSSQIGNLKTDKSPFEIKASIVGSFTFNEEESNGETFEKFLSQNAIAILFPYLRNLVSDVSSKSNEFPTLLLPVVNVVKLLEQKKAITINRINPNE